MQGQDNKAYLIQLGLKSVPYVFKLSLHLLSYIFHLVGQLLPYIVHFCAQLFSYLFSFFVFLHLHVMLLLFLILKHLFQSCDFALELILVVCVHLVVVLDFLGCLYQVVLHRLSLVF